MRLIDSLSDNISRVNFAEREQTTAGKSRQAFDFRRFYLPHFLIAAQFLFAPQLLHASPEQPLAQLALPSLDLAPILIGSVAFAWLVVFSLWIAFRNR